MGQKSFVLNVLAILLLNTFSSSQEDYVSLFEETYSFSVDKYRIDSDKDFNFLKKDVSKENFNLVIDLLYNDIFRHDTEQCKNDKNYVIESYANYTKVKMESSKCKTCICKDTTAAELAQFDWIEKLLDSFGTKGSYVREGNFYQLGGYHECLTTSHSQFNGKYCTLSSMELPKQPDQCDNKTETSNITFIPIKYGFCIPNTCFVNKIGENRMSLNMPDYTITFNINCHEALDMSQDIRAISVVCLFSFFGLILLVATLYDLVTREIDIDKSEKSLPLKVLLCFSVLSNSQKLLSTSFTEGQLNCVHGVRFISMSWVILGHTYIFAIISFDNIVRVFDVRSEFTEQIILNGTFSVDTFFVLSGTLLCFLWLNETQKRNGKNITSFSHWILYYVMRFIRLTPPYMLIMGFDIAIFRYITDGPLWNQFGFEKDFCKDTWWTNLIYLNNFIDPSKMCMGWTWYLANDMQFHWVAPVVLILLWKLPKIGIVFSALLVIVSSATNFGISYVNNYPPNQINFNKNSSQFSSDATGYFDGVYVKPYTRAGPFFLGLILGYFLFKAQGKNWKLTTPFNATCWLIAAGLNLSVAYGLYGVANGNIMNKIVSALYSGVARSVWGLGVCWVIFACVTNNGGLVNRFLSWKVFMPLSRLTYCAYLIHPLVLLLAYTGRQTALHFDSDYTMVYYFIANLVISYGLAFIATLAFESPVINLQKLFFASFKSGSKSEKSNISTNGYRVEPEIIVQEMKPEYLEIEKSTETKDILNPQVAKFEEIQPKNRDVDKMWEASIRKLGQPKTRPQINTNPTEN